MRHTIAILYLLFAWFAFAFQPHSVVAAGCDATSEPACMIVQGLLQGLGLNVNINKCVGDVTQALTLFEQGAQSFGTDGSYTTAMTDWSQALEELATATSDCKVSGLNQLFDEYAKQFGLVNVTKSVDGAVHIWIEGVDVYNDLYTMYTALTASTPNYGAFGKAIADLIAQVHALQCSTPACTVMDGILRALQMVIPHLPQCSKDLDAAWVNFEAFSQVLGENVSQEDAATAVRDLTAALYQLSKGATDCSIPDLGRLIATEAQKLGLAAFSQDVKGDIQILVNSVNLYETLYTAGQDVISANYADFGHQMGTLIAELETIGCSAESSEACEVVNEILNFLAVFVPNVPQCSADLAPAITLLQQVANEFETGDYQGAVDDLAAALDDVAEALSVCQVQQVADLLTQLAATLKIANITLGSTVTIIVEGANVYDDIYEIATSLSQSPVDYTDFGAAVSDLISILQASHCTTPVCTIVTGLLQAAGLVVPHISVCSNELDQAWQQLGTFVYDIQNGNPEGSVQILATALYTISEAMDDCEIPALGRLVSSLATKLGAATVATDASGVVTVIVDGVDLYQALFLAAQDLAQGQYQDFGLRIGALVTILDSLGCSDARACEVAEGLLQMLEIIVPDLTKCSADMTQGLDSIESGFQLFGDEQYEQAIAAFALGLHDFGTAVSDCGLEDVANLIEKEAQLLGVANVSVIGTTITIVVDGVDLYQDIYKAYIDFTTGNYNAFGQDMAVIITAIQTTGCTSPACEVVEAILSLLRVAVPDFRQCSADLDMGWDDLESGAQLFMNGEYVSALSAIGTGLAKLGDGLNDCGVPSIANTIIQYAELLGIGNVTVIGTTVHILVNGVDFYEDLYSFAVDMEQANYKAAAGAIAGIISDVRVIGCTNPACEVVQGLLETLQIVISHLVQCETDLDGVWKYFETAVTDFKAEQYGSCMEDFANAFYEMGQGVGACGVPELAVTLDNIFKLFNFNSINLEEAVKILVAGVDVYDDIYAVIVDYEHQEYRQLGRDLGTLVQEIMSVSGTKCDDNDGCLVFEGILEALLVVPDWGVCKTDITDGWSDLETCGSDFADHDYKSAVEALADAGHDFAEAVQTCEVAEIASILEELAKKLGFGSWIWWIEDLVKIIVDGADIYEDCYNLYEDVEAKNYLGVGLDLASLIKLLILSENQNGQAVMMKNGTVVMLSANVRPGLAKLN